MHFYELKNNRTLYISIAFGGWLLNTIANLVLSNNLSADDYGDMVVALNFLNLLSLVLAIGIPNLIANVMPDLAQDQNPRQAQARFIHWTIKALFSTSIISYILIIGFLAFIVTTQKWAIYNQIHLAYTMLLIAPIYSFASVINALIAITGKAAIARAVNTIIFPITLLLAFLSVQLFKTPGPVEVIWTIFFSTVVLFIITGILLYSYQKHFFPHALLNTRSQLFSSWLKQSLVYLQINFLSVVNNTGPLYLLEWLGPSETDVAVYGVMGTIQGLIVTIRSTLYFGLFANEAKLMLGQDHHKLQQTMNELNIAVYASCFVLAVLIAVFHEPILASFGTIYTNYSMILYGFLISSAISLLCSCGWIICDVTAKGSKFLDKAYAMHSLYLILNIPACYYYGIAGLMVCQILYRITLTASIMVKARAISGLKTGLIA